MTKIFTSAQTLQWFHFLFYPAIVQEPDITSLVSWVARIRLDTVIDSQMLAQWVKFMTLGVIWFYFGGGFLVMYLQTRLYQPISS